jgi:eukaryotic-like serine/threonine-protein kinase
VLAAGIQDITNSLVDERFKLNEVLRMVMETMLRALNFRRVVLCLRDAKTGMIIGRLGVGEGAAAVAPLFQIPLKTVPGSTPDLFSLVCIKAADTLIADARAPQIAQRLPPWFSQKVAAPSFLLLPLQHRDAPLGLLYADRAEPGGVRVDEKELNLLRTLRNQAVMAFRQATR